MKWTETANTLHTILSKMTVTDIHGQNLSHDQGFASWYNLAATVKETHGRLFLIGNGASSSMASHFGTDITKNGGIKTHVFTDASLLSAVCNDYSYVEMYAKPLQWYASKGDMLVAISSSGNSANIVEACVKARLLDMNIVTLSAMGPDNRIRKLGDINFFINASTYGCAESGHAVILHHWMDILESRA